MTTDVVVALLGGATAGAVLTGLFTLYSGWLTRRHEHRRWLLDKRLEAYSAMNTAVGARLKAFTHADRFAGDITALTDATDDLTDKQQAVRLLGSPTTRRHIRCGSSRIPPGGLCGQ